MLPRRLIRLAVHDDGAFGETTFEHRARFHRRKATRLLPGVGQAQRADTGYGRQKYRRISLKDRHADEAPRLAMSGGLGRETIIDCTERGRNHCGGRGQTHVVSEDKFISMDGSSMSTSR